jgi:ATP-dependent RNA helicase DHX57
LFALLLFGGQLTINHFAGGITVGKEGNIRLKAWSRIGILANQLRRLLDARLAEVIESSGEDVIRKNDDIVTAMLTLLPP